MRTLIAFGVGVGVGAVATWLYLTEKYKELLVGDSESNENDEIVVGTVDKDQTETIIASYQGTINNKEEVVDKIEPKKEATPSSIIRKVAQKVDYNKAAEIAADVVTSAVVPSEMEYPQDGKSPETKPYKIGPAQFANEQKLFDKVSLVYYLEDETLALHPDELFDESEGESQVIQDIDATIGRDNLKCFGEYEPGMLYVRNEGLGADYSIELKFGKYSAGVHMK